MMLSLMLVAAVPVHAGSLSVSDVAQVLVASRSGGASAQLRLRAVSQTSNLVSSAPRSAGQDPQNPGGNSTTPATGSADATGAATQLAITQDPSAPNIETIELGDVTGTICDCGEIAIPGGGGFPLYPLFALGAIPLAFLDFGDETEFFDNPPDTPDVPIPEPATLLLLGSGLAALGAGARRRRRAQADSLQSVSVKEV